MSNQNNCRNNVHTSIKDTRFIFWINKWIIGVWCNLSSNIFKFINKPRSIHLSCWFSEIDIQNKDKAKYVEKVIWMVQYLWYLCQFISFKINWSSWSSGYLNCNSRCWIWNGYFLWNNTAESYSSIKVQRTLYSL